MTVFESLLAAFLAAHFVADFLLQTDRDVAEKDRPAVLLRHGAIHGVLVLVLTGTWHAWAPALVIATTHVAIDYGKRRFVRGGWRAFLGDQLLHLLVLTIAAAFGAREGLMAASLWDDFFGSAYFQLLAVAAGAVATIAGGAFFVDLAVESFLAQISTGRAHASDEAPGETSFESVERSAGARLRGLRQGGRTIGQLERALIFVFVLVNQFSAIGFLIAAKSVFRFGELRDRSNRMEAEYIIIGTLISFLWAIVVALLTRLAAGL